MRYWSDSNPHVLHESSLYAEKITVCCGLWAGVVIGPYFFRDDQDRHVTANGNRYNWPQLDDMDLTDMWLQQSGVTSHKANVTINLLGTKFGKCVGRLGRDAVRLFPVGLCQVYGLWSIDELCTNIEPEIAAVSAEYA